MGFITTKKGVKWVRLVIPDDLVPVIGKKNLMESLETKDNRVASERSPSVIARFQEQIAQARGQATWEKSPLGRVLAAHPNLRRLEEIADFVAEQGGETPFVAEPNVQSAATSTGEPVRFESMVELWGRERNIPDRTQRMMLSKTNRFMEWLEADRQTRGLPSLADDMRLVGRDDYIRYKEDMLKPGSGYSHTTVKHHLDDLRTLYKFASKNRSFANPDRRCDPAGPQKRAQQMASLHAGRTDQDLDRSSQRGNGHPLVPVGRMGDGCQGQRDRRSEHEGRVSDRRHVVYQNPARQPRGNSRAKE
jgi:hypothetical protein